MTKKKTEFVSNNLHFALLGVRVEMLKSTQIDNMPDILQAPVINK